MESMQSDTWPLLLLGNIFYLFCAICFILLFLFIEFWVTPKFKHIAVVSLLVLKGKAIRLINYLLPRYFSVSTVWWLCCNESEPYPGWGAGPRREPCTHSNTDSDLMQPLTCFWEVRSGSSLRRLLLINSAEWNPIFQHPLCSPFILIPSVLLCHIL